VASPADDGCPWCRTDDERQCGVCLAPNGDPLLKGQPRGSVVHRITLDGRESTTILTGYRHLLAPNASEKDKGMVTAECGDKGRPYVWKGVGTRVTSTSRGVTCPRCIATPRFQRMLGQNG
jgi:hypothetical protein